MNEPIEIRKIVRDQQKFDLHDILNLIEIEINNERISNMLKKYNCFRHQ